MPPIRPAEWIRGPMPSVRGSGLAHRRLVGGFGETLAARFLTARGVRILGRNVRVGRGEIDIHALVGGVSVAVEVRTILTDTEADDATRRFTAAKAATVRRYAALLEPPAHRVDLVAVTFRDVTVDVRWLPFSG